MSQGDETAFNTANILYLSPSSAATGRDIDLLSVADPADTAALLTTYAPQWDPGEWLRSWEKRTGDRPAEAQIISIGDFTRSAARSAGDARTNLPNPLSMKTVENPGDLTGLGIAISESVDEWAHDEWDSGPSKLVCCFDSLTVLLQYAELDRVFRFLHVLTGRFRSADATALFHLDPDAHDEQTVATLRTLFDAVVEVGDDGDLTTTTR